MSYILDALRRADAERERGTVPSLHTQQFGVLPGDDEAPPRPRLLIGAVVLLGLALAGVLAWTFLGSSEPPPKPVPPVATAPATPLATTPPPTASTAFPAPRSVASAPAPTVVARAPSTPTVAAAPRPPARPAVRRETPATPSATAGVPPAEDRIYSLAELPDAIRRELPKIAYGGGSYSPDKASRLAFLNGQVFHEGDTIAPGLVLRQVRQKGAILAYKGYRFEIGP
jgi:general secretion pathway protein B